MVKKKKKTEAKVAKEIDGDIEPVFSHTNAWAKQETEINVEEKLTEGFNPDEPANINLTTNECLNTNEAKQFTRSKNNPNIKFGECIRAETADSLKTKTTSINKNVDQDSNCLSCNTLSWDMDLDIPPNIKKMTEILLENQMVSWRC